MQCNLHGALQRITCGLSEIHRVASIQHFPRAGGGAVLLPVHKARTIASRHITGRRRNAFNTFNPQLERAMCYRKG